MTNTEFYSYSIISISTMQNIILNYVALQHQAKAALHEGETMR